MTGLTSLKWEEFSLNLLRIITGFLFVSHGAPKLYSILGGQGLGIFTLFGFSGILEFFGGTAILLGLFTRPVAFVLAGQMAVAYWMFFGHKAVLPILNGGELPALYCFVFLFLSTRGGGDLSIDGWLQRRRHRAPVKSHRLVHYPVGLNRKPIAYKLNDSLH